MSEQRMTRAEWVQYEEKLDCTRGGHAPSSRSATYANPIGWFRCECGDVTWKPEQEENK